MTGGMLLNGCVRHIPTSLPMPDLASPLTIDVHCHFFNGTDLQMAKFLEKVVDADGRHRGDALLAPLAQDFDWSFAPSGKAELRRLHADHLTEQEAHKRREKARAVAYNKFHQQLATANISQSPASQLPKDYKEYASNTPVLSGGTFSALKEYFQYRYVALADYLNIYKLAGGRTIDLMIAHLVDYDWPLNNGHPTRTHLNDQVELMEKISILSKGRVHTFAPFDPFREIAYRARIRGAKWSSLETVQRWIERHGCIGVKFYPPMGFAPYGNSQVPLDTWKSRWQWLPDVKNVPDRKGRTATIGERLDEVLYELYTWCVDKDLPLMAHTSLTNGLLGFDNFPAAKYWAALPDKFRGLRVNFGHIGGLERTSANDWNNISATSDINARDLVGLMSTDTSAMGGHFYGDSAFSQNVLTHRDVLLSVYKAALSWKAPGQSRPILQDRLMYGSDWSLIMQEKDMEAYFDDFVWMFSQLDQMIPPSEGSSKTLSSKFFGENAVDYLGLRDGATRQRLTNFYADHNATFEPAWITKTKS